MDTLLAMKNLCDARVNVMKHYKMSALMTEQQQIAVMRSQRFHVLPVFGEI